MLGTESAAAKLRACIAEACQGLVDREALVELVVPCAVTREHMLVLARAHLLRRPRASHRPGARRRLAGVRGVTRLPPALRPWAPELAKFAGDLGVALAGLAARMAQFLELAPRRRAAEEVPDGYDGVTRRGPYERLLPSEWMWLDASPDEFLRRAISGEHAFFRRAHRKCAAAGRIVLLFDSGPDQLGGPRLVQLALAVVFARYARERGAELAWGSLQRESSSLRSGF